MEGSRVDVMDRVNGIILTFRLLILSMRPWEWIKNTFLFAALFFSHNLFNTELLWIVLWAFVIYCVACSGVYLINDICDKEEDRRHPQKRLRPITSGGLSVGLATTAAAILVITAVSGSFLLSAEFGILTGGYVVLNVAYSRWLKHVVIVDVFSIAAGFVLRVVSGAVVIDVVLSHWLLICTVLLALFMGFTKRRYELVALAHEAILHRRVLREYNPLFLDMMIGIVTSATLIAYVLYTVNPETVQRFQTDRLILTVPFVLYGIFRYLYLLYQKEKAWSPAHVILSDGPLLINVMIWLLVCGLVIYNVGG